MSIALSYDAGLSRVRITGAVPGFVDTFSRTVANNWTPADSGQAWTNTGGAAGDFDIASGFGTHAHTSVNVFRTSLAVAGGADTDHAVTFKTSVQPVGAPHTIEILARYVDSSNLYAARLSFNTTANQITLSIRKRVAGVQTVLITQTYAVVSTTAPLSVRFRVVGSTLQAKVWTSVEPTEWMLEAVDSSLAAAGSIGVRTVLEASNSNTLPVTFSFDSIRSTGTAVVERSTDLVRWETVRGAAELSGVEGTAYTIDDYEFSPDVVNNYRVRVLGYSSTDDTTPVLDSVWLKNLRLPFLNRAVTVTDWGDEEFPARAGEFPIIGRTYPIAVTDLRLPRQYELMLTTATRPEADEIVNTLMAGDPVLVHTPADCDVPSGYYLVGSIRVSRRNPRSPRRYITLPLNAVAIAGPDIVGATTTWSAIIATYATWADLLAANATWQDVLDGIADPEDVIVP